ncbi:MAG: ATP-dependent zinc metalloprotease FtsH [Proteobacteria bacterium]|nr:ATP-dependent zinc metalloprotease FtsH [Pseudomonadota bacterium]
MKSNFRFVLIWVMAIFVILWVVSKSQQNIVAPNSISFSEFISRVKEGKVAEVTFQGNSEIRGKFIADFNKGGNFQTFGDTRSEVYLKLLNEKGIVPNYEPEAKASFWQSALLSWLPILAILFIFYLFMRQLQSGSNKALSFGQSRAKLFNENQSKIRFKDVAGCDEAKDDLKEVVEFLKSPKKFTRLGGRIPKGVLLIGPPGTGKTLLAKAVAGEASVPFFSISGSDFVEMFVGVGASRVRSLFENARKAAPCLVFIDEIDAVGRHRGAGLGGGHDEREQTLNQLLVEMDGFEGTEGIIIIAATNRPDVLDPALLRPGRFDRRVMVSKPDLKGRLEILKVHTKRTPIDESVDLEVVARGTPGYSGADLENLVNESAIHAARRDSDKVQKIDFAEAQDKVSMGSARKSMVISDEEKKHTAYHEAGHAMVGRLVAGNDPVHKVTIIPRGPALGVTMSLPTEDRYTLTKEKAEALIAYMMGGRCAEEIIFKHFTTGASNDIERATDLARKMVTEWGMSERLGPLNFGSKNDNVFLGREIVSHNTYSPETGQLIDQEIREIVERNHTKAKKVLNDNIEKLHALADALLEYETIDAQDIDTVFAGKKVTKEILTTSSSKASDSKDGSEKSEVSSGGVLPMGKAVKV